MVPPATKLSKIVIPVPPDRSYSDDQAGSTENIFEFDESEVWTSSSNQAAPSPEARKKIIDLPKKLQPRKTISSVVGLGSAAASSLPVNIPDWSKIMKDDDDCYHRHRQGSWDDVEEEDGGGDHRETTGKGVGCWIPPHEYLARRRGASFSVQEGVGRTLKGRDLRRVRNAIWKEIGFED